MKNKRKTTKVHCNNCNIVFDKAISEVKRTEKRGGYHYCSSKCAAIKNSKKNLGKWGVIGNYDVIKNVRHSDEYTPFREYLRRANRRKLIGDLSLFDIKKVWDEQNGICPYTGIKLKLYTNKETIHIFELASLDRIDSNKLYEIGNIVFVSTPINYMKNSMTEKDTIEYCKIIAEYWKK
jgi:hypothetical protein